MPAAARRRRRIPASAELTLDKSLPPCEGETEAPGDGDPKLTETSERSRRRRNARTKAMTFDPSRVFGLGHGSQEAFKLDPEVARFKARQGQAGSRHAGATPTRPCDCMLCRYVPG